MLIACNLISRAYEESIIETYMYRLSYSFQMYDIVCIHCSTSRSRQRKDPGGLAN